VWCWGAQENGDLGSGAGQGACLGPGPVGGLPAPVVSVAAGFSHTCALLAHGSTSYADDVYCWGSNAFLQLGDAGYTGGGSTPALAERGGLALAAGDDDTYTLVYPAGDGGNDLVEWGDNSQEELGLAGGGNGPVSPGLMDTWAPAAVAAGSQQACATTGNGFDGAPAYCWGASHLPTPVGSSPLKFSALAVGNGHGCGIDASRCVWCWGDNNSGDLGVQDAGREAELDGGVPVPVNVPCAAAALAAGDSHACALLLDGGILCWGNNTFGQLGNANAGTPSPPVPVVFQ
jgi:alpha-tubulin suppressor-like RCC1 family protein